MDHIRHRMPFWVIAVIVMTLTVGAAIGTTVWLIRQDTVAASRQEIQQHILRVAKETAALPAVKRVVRSSNQGSQQNLQNDMQELNRGENTDFIVVLNRQLIRLSHPKRAEVGKPFSSTKDPQPALNGHTHFSEKPGVLGPEYRVFYPIRTAKAGIIGVVCVGITQRNLTDQLRRQTHPILLGGLIGLLSGLVLVLGLSLYLRRLLLGMSPREIAEKTTQQALIDNALPEGIVAVDQRQRLLSVNQAAQRLFGPGLVPGQRLSASLQALLFPQPAVTGNREVDYQDKQLLVTTNPLIVRHRAMGQVSLIKDTSEMAGLIDRLAGTEHYVSSLRAQTHEFMNQLQVIHGLLELEEYPRARSFIQEITQTYHQEVGHVSDRIKWPAMVGLILGKTKEAQEQQVRLVIAPTTVVVGVTPTDHAERLVLRIVSNLLDNAIAACHAQPAGAGRVVLALEATADGQQLTIAVTDNGSGMTATVRENLFKQGYSTKGPRRGYGMGLIAAAVTALQGDLTIQPQDPHGTQIVIHVNLQVGDEAV